MLCKRTKGKPQRSPPRATGAGSKPVNHSRPPSVAHLRKASPTIGNRIRKARREVECIFLFFSPLAPRRLLLRQATQASHLLQVAHPTRPAATPRASCHRHLRRGRGRGGRRASGPHASRRIGPAKFRAYTFHVASPQSSNCVRICLLAADYYCPPLEGCINSNHEVHAATRGPLARARTLTPLLALLSHVHNTLTHASVPARARTRIFSLTPTPHSRTGTYARKILHVS